MKVLLSAYACEPNRGSEPGVGWNWAIEIARLGHNVWVLTWEGHRQAIEKEIERNGIQENLQFVFYELSGWRGTIRNGQRAIRTHYYLWQWGAYQLAKSLHERIVFDQVHHITFGTGRMPSFMGRLNIPFVFGPIGGGERAPLNLRNSFGFNGWIIDAIRDIAIFAAKYDPLMKQTYRSATSILVKTPQSLSLIPDKYREKSELHLEIGFEPPNHRNAHDNPATAKKQFQILFAGRLLDLKGMHLGLRAFTSFLQFYPNSTLSIVGQGSSEKRLKNLSQKLNITHKVNWIPKLPQKDLFDLYLEHDVFLFPSLHDSSGNVVLEAMAHRLPVICLDLGGPAEMIDDTCGIVVSTKLKTEGEVVSALCLSLTKMMDFDFRLSLKKGALIRANSLTWNKTVSKVYQSVKTKELLETDCQ